ncbi:hypothetical protein PG2083B_0514 [Bifidobacterium pseudolongum subsp. globosum]|uniref:hypothetical protein n=1 Tax=Bifidobacterium pseudolongum TaxID=1694 RepID=UPI0010E05BEF|nr:hypothetical protein [Bifidobacterium pseudolongum]RYQ18375.1 hypothetical protein PG2083B_0514 [Bifidobacterium pseudolongum subsp. globosum]
MGWFSNDDETYRVIVKHMFDADEVIARGIPLADAQRIRDTYTGPGNVVITRE